MKTWPGMAAPYPDEPEFLSWVREQLIKPEPPVLRWCRIDPDGPGLHAPKRDGDIGWDLEASERVLLYKHRQADVPTNIRIQLPPDCWGEIRSRSSIAQRNLIVPATVLDNGYTGPIFVLLYNANPWSNEIARGERAAQLVIHQGVWCEGVEVDCIEDDPRRGNAAFGSTGC